MRVRFDVIRFIAAFFGGTNIATYKNASDILPADLLRELQRYVDGDTVYVPSCSETAWGEKSGGRQRLRERNDEIRALYAESVPIGELSRRFYLSEDSIRKIIKNKS